MFSLVGFYICILVEVKVTNTQVINFRKVVKPLYPDLLLHCFNILYWLRRPLLFSPLGEISGF